MNILVIGSGGREHSLCWSIAASPLCDTLYCAPGNGGIREHATCVDLDSDNADAVIAFCQDHKIGLVVVGPEAPLVAGLVDRLRDADIKAFGPTAKAARLEGSKGFTKDLCTKYGIPTAAYGRFTDANAAKMYVQEAGLPIVIKADGLAAGKGVIIAETLDEALGAIDDMFGGRFGEAGAEVVVEEFMEGEEASFFALVDGENAIAMATAQDHKRVFDGDKGPNTGGMGAYSPAPVIDDAIHDRVMEEIILPTVEAMKAEDCPYSGVLYAGLILTDEGPKLIEYNCRFGDPECQVLMVRLKSDLVAAMLASVDGVLDKFELRWRDECALTVVMAAKGYPGAYDKGSEIGNLEGAGDDPDVVIFHAGTACDNGSVTAITATGGRVLGVTALAESVTGAAQKAYAAVDRIDWEGGFCRRDIGWRAIEREGK